MLPNPFSKLLLTTMLIVITIILLSGCSVTTNPSNEWYMSAIKPKGVIEDEEVTEGETEEGSDKKSD